MNYRYQMVGTKVARQWPHVALVAIGLSFACERERRSRIDRAPVSDDICEQAGRLTYLHDGIPTYLGAGERCPEPQNWMAPPMSDIALYPSYAGSLPACEGIGAGHLWFRVKFRVERIWFSESPHVETVAGIDAQVLEAFHDGTPVPVAEPCGQRFFITTRHSANRLPEGRLPNGGLSQTLPGGGPGIVLDVVPGAVMTLDRRMTFRADFDVLRTVVLRDEAGLILWADVNGARPDFYDSDLLPEIALELPMKNMCQGTVDLAKITLRAGDAECALESYSERCCTLFGAVYEVLCNGALYYAQKPVPMSQYGWGFANFALRRRGFFKYAN